MNADTYQKEAHGLVSYGDPGYPYFGLAGEAGKVAGKVAEFVRRNDGITPWSAAKDFPNALKEQNAKFRDDMMSELSDVMWMVSEIAATNGLTLEEIMDYNIQKLTEREAGGSGTHENVPSHGASDVRAGLDPRGSGAGQNEQGERE
jgi:predicted house-cleaning noncanonical NTP pyrophosphatase (MazG superfamily)